MALAAIAIGVLHTLMSSTWKGFRHFSQFQSQVHKMPAADDDWIKFKQKQTVVEASCFINLLIKLRELQKVCDRNERKTQQVIITSRDIACNAIYPRSFTSQALLILIKKVSIMYNKYTVWIQESLSCFHLASIQTRILFCWKNS